MLNIRYGRWIVHHNILKNSRHQIDADQKLYRMIGGGEVIPNAGHDAQHLIPRMEELHYKILHKATYDYFNHG